MPPQPLVLTPQAQRSAYAWARDDGAASSASSCIASTPHATRPQKDRWHARSAAGADRDPAPNSRSNPAGARRRADSNARSGPQGWVEQASAVMARPCLAPLPHTAEEPKPCSLEVRGRVAQEAGSHSGQGGQARMTAEGSQAFVPVTLCLAALPQPGSGIHREIPLRGRRGTWAAFMAERYACGAGALRGLGAQRRTPE